MSFSPRVSNKVKTWETWIWGMPSFHQFWSSLPWLSFSVGGKMECYHLRFGILYTHQLAKTEKWVEALDTKQEWKGVLQWRMNSIMGAEYSRVDIIWPVCVSCNIWNVCKSAWLMRKTEVTCTLATTCRVGDVSIKVSIQFSAVQKKLIVVSEWVVVLLWCYKWTENWW
jgi:hypothetical protein